MSKHPFLYVCMLLTACPEPGDDAGGAGEPSVCDSVAFTACGGDPAGTWRAEAICPGVLRQQRSFNDDPACTGSALTVEGSASDYTVELTAAGRYSLDYSLELSGEAVVEQACLDVMSGETNADLATYCATLETNLRDDFSSADCAVSAGACRCAMARSGHSTETGDYSVAASEITMVSDDPEDEVETDPFCVSGDRLTVRAATDDQLLVFRRN
jgi:hypothetical protein